ncbi:MAG: hypothetical protein QOJ43_1624 [Gaiellaceae bacterium]|nr:hypothetical protein [Gaiellaceae bacterium]
MSATPPDPVTSTAMHEPPLPPPHLDWRSPDIGEAIRIILDSWDSLRVPQPEKAARTARLGQLVREQPEVTVAAFFAIFNSSLELPALLPAPVEQAGEVRKQVEKKVYDDIDLMPDPE